MSVDTSSGTQKIQGSHFFFYLNISDYMKLDIFICQFSYPPQLLERSNPHPP